MAKSFRGVDRDQQFLLPPDMSQWLPEGHLAWFVISTVDELDMSVFEDRHRLGGVGRAAFDPRMLLALLIYAYAVGQRSSRQIERLCATDVGFRVICAQDVPDHTTIARFRQRHEAGVSQLFTQVLLLCAEAGLGRVGVVAIDGTKIAADASISATRTEASLRAEAQRILGEAAAVDAAEDALFGDARGDELPPEWTDPRTRRGKIRAALAELDARKAAEKDAAVAKSVQIDEHWARRVARAEADLAATHERVQSRYDRHRQAQEDAAAGKGKRPAGSPPVPPEKHVHVRTARKSVEVNKARRAQAASRAQAGQGKTEDSRTVNLTDPHSGPMPTRCGWVQGYNAQLAVSEDQIILAAVLTRQPGDVEQLMPMMDKALQAAQLMNQARKAGAQQEIGLVLADAGYLSEDNLNASGPDRLIAVGKRRDLEREARDNPATGDPPGTDPITLMQHRLRTEEGIRTYRRRGAIVEPVNGHVKDRRGLRRFARRGLAAAQSELHLAAAVTNLLKLYRAPAPATG